jgi:sugar/nucleoside kinase (ribokinase family)
MDVIAIGIHVLDVLVRPVESIPEGDMGQLVEQIAFSPAGTAGGTAVTLAKLGARVRSAGAVGTDAIGDLLVTLLERYGVDTSLLQRREGVQTSTTVLPIRPNGDRPAFHVVGANGAYGADDAPYAEIASATHLHVGGPEFFGPEGAARILAHARDAGVVTSADLAVPGGIPGMLPVVAPSLPYLDYLLPNVEQLTGFAETDDPIEAARIFLKHGVGCVAATRGARGALVVHAAGVEEAAAFAVDVVDTSGCGDAFSAGFMSGIALGRTPKDAAILGNAVAGLVASGLGSDFGDFDLETADAFAAETTTRQS